MPDELLKLNGYNCPNGLKNIQLHEYIIMPNHFHPILEPVGATLVVAPNTHAPQTPMPPKILTTKKGNLKGLPLRKRWVIWLGHSNPLQPFNISVR